MLDLCYEEDSGAQVDLNCVMTGEGALVELRAPARAGAFTIAEQQALVDLCAKRASGRSSASRNKFWEADAMKMVLASKNAHKLTEMKDILSRLGVEVVLESEAGVDVDVEETE